MGDSDIDKFLNHSTKAKNNSTFAQWKDKGFIEVWLHTKLMPTAVWRHQLPMIVPIEDKETKQVTRFLWSKQFVCHEDEEILKSQYFRDDDGNRKRPPEKCGICKLIEYIRERVETGDLSWVDPVFKFEGKNKNEKKKIVDHEVILHAGGITNLFGKRDLSEAEKKDLKAHDIYRSEAWKENAIAKANYIFAIVDHNDVKSGVQIAIESNLLGDKVKTVITDRMKSKGKEAGNPAKNPFAIRWEFNDEEQEFGKKYHALPLDEHKLTPAIKDLILGDEPNINKLVEPFNQKTMRNFLEKHCLIEDVPWDEFFGKASKSKRDESDDEPPPESEEKPAKKGRTPEVSTKSSKKSPEPEEDEDEDEEDEDDSEDEEPEEVACDNKKCGKPMMSNWNKCPACKTEYEGEGLIDPPAPKPEKVKRSARTAKRTAKPAASDDEDDGPSDDDQGAHIPF